MVIEYAVVMEIVTHYLNPDSLLSNNVTELKFDQESNVWIGM